MSSHTMQSSAHCSVCNSGGHAATRCPELRAPLKEGFYMGGGVSKGSSDDDESLQIPKIPVKLFEAICV